VLDGGNPEIVNADDDGNGFVDDVNGWNFYDGTNQTLRTAPKTNTYPRSRLDRSGGQ